MKKMLIVVCLLSLILVAGCSTKTGWEDANLNGKVKKITVTVYNAEKKGEQYVKLEKATNGHYMVRYDEKGKYLETIMLDMNGNIQGKSMPSYEGSKYVGSFEFDGKDQLMRKYTVKEYKNGLPVETLVFDDNGEQIERIVSEYNGDLNTSSSCYDQNGSLMYKITTEFDANGNRIRYSTGDSYSRRIEYLEYDEQKNWTRCVEVVEKGGNQIEIMERKIEYYR
jgi:hypothetical protein